MRVLAGLAALLAAAPIPGAFAQSDGPAPAPAPYVDQLIDPDSPASVAARQEAEEVALRETPGLDSTFIETKAYHYGSSPGGSLTETGIVFQHRRETLNHGEWMLEGSGLLSSSGSNSVYGGSPDRRRVRFQLRQQYMPLRVDLLWSNALGVIRMPSSTSGDYLSRFQLPGTLIAGASTQLDRRRSSIYAGVGEAARADGGQGLGWRSTAQLAIGAGWAWQNADGWRAGIDIARIGADSSVPGSSAAAGGFAGIGGIDPYGSATTAAFTIGGRDKPEPDQRLARWRWQYRLLAGDSGRFGHSLDGRLRQGLGTWSGSAWAFDPGLSWYGNLLSSGQHGIAMRHDHVDPTLFWGMGADWARDRPWLEGAPALESRGLSGSVGFKTALGRSVGLAAQWREISPQGGANGGGSSTDVMRLASTRQSLSLNYSRGIRDYSDRWQLSWIGNRANGATSSLYELEWSADRTLDEGSSIGGFAGIGLHRDETGASRWRPTIGGTWTLQPADRWQVHSYLRYSRDVTNDLSSYAWAGGVRVGYQIDRRWRVALDGGLNQGAVTSTKPSEPLFATVQTTKQRDRSVWLTLSYQDAGGVPYSSLTGSARRGAGRIEGLVFQDENGDGVRQSNEKPAANVSLRLDNGMVARTDATGRFEFPIAGVGSRKVFIDPETVRLPWGVASDTPQGVEVELRGTAVMMVPLLRTGD